MSSSSGPSSGSAPSQHDIESVQLRIETLFTYQPDFHLEPLVENPEPDSKEELNQFYQLCLIFLLCPLDVRRSLLLGEDHVKVAVLALTFLRCPYNLLDALWKFRHVFARMVFKFGEWRSCWVINEGDSDMSVGPVECLKRLARKNLYNTSLIEAKWLEIFIRIFGDLPELWFSEPPLFHSPPATSESASLEDDDVMATYPSDSFFIQTPQVTPASMPDFGIIGSDENSAGRLPFGQPISGPTSATYQGPASSFQSLPPPVLSQSAFGAYNGEVSASQSLPNLPSGRTSQDMSPGGFDSGYQNPLTTWQQPAPTPPNSTTSSTSVPGANPMVTGGHNATQGLGNTPGPSFAPPAEQSETPSIQELIALELARATSLANRGSVIRSQTAQVKEFLQVLNILMKFFYDGLHRIMCGDELDIPLPQDHRAALEDGAKSIGLAISQLLENWSKDMKA